jgi:hypothetical protein
MTTHFDDEQLAAYALGELEASKCAAMETFLQTDETARRIVSEFQTAARWAAEALSPAPADALTDAQRRAILTHAQAAGENAGKARGKSAWRRVPYRRWGLGLAVAAGILMVAGTAFYFPQFRAGTAPMASSFAWFFDTHANDGDYQANDGVATGERRNVRADFTDNVQAWVDLNGNDFFAGPMVEQRTRLNAERGRMAGGGMGGMGAMGGFGGGMGARGYEGKAAKGTSAGYEVHDVNLLLADNSAEAPAAAEELRSGGYIGGKADLPKENTPQLPEEAPDRYLIKNATFNLEVEDARQACEQLTGEVAAVGGYVSNLDEQTDGLGRRRISLQVRVPADQIDGAMTGLEALGRVLAKNVNTEDVTEEYTDTDARVRNLKKTEERLLDHLSKAFLIDNTLKIETELSRVREQLERLEGRLRYLGHRVRFSTIAVTLQEKPKAEALRPVQTFSSAQVVSEALRSLVAFGQRLWERVLWLAVWSPVWGLLLALAVLVYRRLRKRLRARKENA